MQENRNDNHKLTVEARKSVTLTEVDGVLAFNENKITLVLRDGTRVHVGGNGLKIVGFSKADGNFLAVGEISSVQYGGKTFMQKLFK